MSRPLFRKEAMEQLASPDQLDQLMEVTTPRGWLALLTLGILLLVALLWGIFGSVPTRVAGEGVILFKQGVFSVFAEQPGKVQSVSVREGEKVAKGQIVATIHSQAMQSKIDDLGSKLSVLRQQYEEDRREDREAFKSFQELLNIQSRNYEAALAEAQRAFRSFQENVKSQKATLEQTAHNQKTRLNWLRQKLVRHEELYRDQLIPLETLNSVRQEVLDGENEVGRLGNDIGNLDLQESERKDALEEKRRTTTVAIEGLRGQERDRRASMDEKRRHADTEIRNLENELKLAKESARSQTVLTSPHSGRVLKLEAKTGVIVNAGDRVMTLESERSEGDLKDEIFDAVVYVSSTEGKRIKAAMDVQIIPSTVKAEEYGVMLGRVVSVSDFPISQHAMLQVLDNPELVQTFLKRGAPIEVWVDILPDPRNLSGYRWSSPTGPPEKIYSGTLCAANVVVRRQAPISLVIPLLREAVLGREGMRGE